MKKMKKSRFNYLKMMSLLAVVFIAASCERELSDDFTLATFSTTAEIFTDAPIGMGSNFYFPYGPDATNPVGSKLTAWSVDDNVSYEGSASMRFDVPNANDPEGNFAGALFLIDGAGRNLSGFNALTFWAKASQGATISEIGFGESEFATKITNVSIGTQWTKYTIPIPDASKLTEERGMLFYSAGSINGLGYTFWLDEVKFENLSDIGQVRPFINNGSDQTGAAFVGQNLTVTGIGVTSNLGTGRDVSVVTTPNYFSFESSNPSVASANGSTVSLVGGGNATITAKIGNIQALGSLNVSSINFAPTPTDPAIDVISIFSDAYTNNPVDYFNGFWTYSTTLGKDDININGNNIIKYTDLNFVGIEFQGAKTIDASLMTHIHMDIYLEETLQPGDFIRIILQDLGSNNVFGGGDDRAGSITLTSTSPTPLVNGNWISVDVPLANFTGLSSKSNLAQIVFVTDGTNPSAIGSIKNIFVDNIYFRR